MTAAHESLKLWTDPGTNHPDSLKPGNPSPATSENQKGTELASKRNPAPKDLDGLPSELIRTYWARGSRFFGSGFGIVIPLPVAYC